MGFSFTVDITIFLSISSNSIFSTKETKHKKNKPKTQRELLSANHQEFCIYSIVLKEAYSCPLNTLLPIKLKLSFLSPNFS